LYQQQNLHTATYQGNQPGHDQYLRSDSQQPSNVQSQYRGMQSKYQPTGNVQSYYQGTSGMAGYTSSSMQNQSTMSQNQSTTAQSQYMNPESFHSAGYRGNQPNHDQSLRADSMQPSSTSATGFSSYQAQSPQAYR